MARPPSPILENLEPLTISASMERDDIVHSPTSSSKLFSSPPAKGKFLELIDDLLHSRFALALKKGIVRELCADATAVLKSEPTMLSIKKMENQQLVVVGDIHGQFCDLIAHILSQQYDRGGEMEVEEEEESMFLFLGDYVDRGPQGVEVIMLLLALKVEYPKRVYLLRGNHEEASTSQVYGFYHETVAKFDDLGIWAMFNELFCFLPLAALVETKGKRFLAVHGGLSPQLRDVATINEIDRPDYGGMLDSQSAEIVDGLLWSDPSDLTTRFAMNERGCGFLFGIATTKEFCERNKLDFICRAHQMTMEGFCWTHENKCLTVFSAPNYCGIANNAGAIMKIGRCNKKHKSTKRSDDEEGDGEEEEEMQFVQYNPAPSGEVVAPPQQPLAYFSQ